MYSVGTVEGVGESGAGARAICSAKESLIIRGEFLARTRARAQAQAQT